MISTIPQRFKSSQGLAYVKMGSGPSLVLIHGVGLRLEAWLNQMSVLAEYFTVYAVDMPGHGESDLFPECQNISDYTDVLARWIESDVVFPVVIAGHSMGSMIALNFAIRYPSKCSGVIAMNSVFRRSEKAKEAVQHRVMQIKENITSENITAPIKRWFDFPLKGDDVQNAQFCREWLEQASLDGYRQAYEVFCLNDGPEDSELRALNVPALFLTGRGDPNSTAEMSEAMAKLCPEGECYLVEGARHMAPMTHYQEINSAIVKFFQQSINSIEEVSHEYE